MTHVTARTLLALLAVSLIGLAGCRQDASELTRRSRIGLLGTEISISSHQQVDDAVWDSAFSLVASLDNALSAHSPDSEVGRINAVSKGQMATALPLSPDLRAVLEQAQQISEASEGAFDVTIGSVSCLWRQDGSFSRLPDGEALHAALPLVNHRAVTLSEQGLTLPAGTQLDLGAIAKGYACDATLAYLREQGVASALLDFGGNIYAHGLKPDGTPWRIGIAVPVVNETGSACVVSVADLAVVTSGGYERFFEQDDTVYHHILDPRTGYPADSGLSSVTVLDQSSTRADALSTACYVLGLEQGFALLETLSGAEGVFITTDNKIYVTTGLSDKLTVTDNRYHRADDLFAEHEGREAGF